MSRRRCDKYASCEECDCYTEYTENLKKAMCEYDYEYMKKFLGHPAVYNNLTSDGRYKKEYNCMIHYYNPNGIYSDNEYNITVKFFKGNEPYLHGFDFVEKNREAAIQFVVSCVENENLIQRLIEEDEIDSDEYEISRIVEDGVVIFEDGVYLK